MNVFSRFLRLLAVSALAAFAAGCAATTSQQTAPVQPAMPRYTSPITPDQVVGKWGLAAYHRPEDAARTEAQARQGCRQPYVINAGSTPGTFMMYLADQSQPSEVVSKQVSPGPIYIGLPDEPPGGEGDREVLRFDGQILVLKWLDPEVSGRYGTMVYVRCP